MENLNLSPITYVYNVSMCPLTWAQEQSVERTQRTASGQTPLGWVVLMPRFLKANFLQEGIIRIVNFFASFTCLCNSNQGPAQEL